MKKCTCQLLIIYAILNQDLKTLSEERSSTFNFLSYQRREQK